VKVLATGGIYVAGGVAVHALAAFESPTFKRKGRLSDLMGRIPIHIVISEAGLAGAATCGLEKAPD
jgi:glucokinase